MADKKMFLLGGLAIVVLILIGLYAFGYLKFGSAEDEYYALKAKLTWFFEEDSEYYFKSTADISVDMEINREALEEQYPEYTEEEIDEMMETYESTGSMASMVTTETELWKKGENFKIKKASGLGYFSFDIVTIITEDEYYICAAETCTKKELEEEDKESVNEVLEAAAGSVGSILGAEYEDYVDEKELFNIRFGDKKTIEGRECQTFYLDIDTEYLEEIVDELKEEDDAGGLDYAGMQAASTLTMLLYVKGPIEECVDTEKGFTTYLSLTIDMKDAYSELYSGYGAESLDVFDKFDMVLEMTSEYEEEVSDDEFEIPEGYEVTEGGY